VQETEREESDLNNMTNHLRTWIKPYLKLLANYLFR
jgi:hypothetical protein